MNKTYSQGVEPRIKKLKRARIKGVESFDHDNLYPNHTENFIDRSVTAKSCVKLFKMFIKGNGFQNQGENEISKNYTLNKLLTDASKDYSKHNGFAIYFGFDLLGNIIEPKVIPFRYCRISEDNKKVIVYDNWDLSKKARIDKDQFKKYDFFDPNHVLESLERGSKGQVLYYSEGGERTYPESTIEAALEDVDSDYECKVFKNSNIRNGFMLKTILNVPKQEEPEEGQLNLFGEHNNPIKRELDNFKGSSGSQIMVVETGEEESPVKATTISTGSDDKQFAYTENSVIKSILRQFNQPAVLHSMQEGGGIGKENYIEAYEIYNNFTQDNRMNVEDVFNSFLPYINGFEKDSILPLDFKSYSNDTNAQQTERVQGDNG